jgi:hypothetical protein
MPLVDFQRALGRAVQGSLTDPTEGISLSAGERRGIDRLVQSAGFRAIQAIQRSWCEGRAAHAARLALSALPLAQRRSLLAQWLAQGGGTRSFISSEADAFLEFIALQLPDPSHALTLARLEQAVHRALAGSREPSDVAIGCHPSSLLRRSPDASMVRFQAEPQLLLDALQGGDDLPPLSERPILVLFAPLLPCLFRHASDEEARLWESLAAPVSVAQLLRGNQSIETIAASIRIGAVERDLRKSA